MNEDLFKQRLLALHYVFPVPLNRLTPLLQVDPKLESLEKMPTHQLSYLLKLSYERTVRFQKSYDKSLETPLLRAYEKHQITPILFNELTYPKQLLTLYDPPVILYAKGNIDYLSERLYVAIIGSREATSYSQEAMNFIIPPLIQQQVVIVSGLAKGADAMAHSTTHQLGGKTIAVVGHGLFTQYPKENKALFEIMENNQLILTEYPPYVTPKKWTFPMRNRIISGLSQAVVVTEAKEKSGTVSTMQHSIDNGKDVFCVPGSIASELSVGPHLLLNEGAKPVWNGFQILAELKANVHQN
jgi:DNA processing protein